MREPLKFNQRTPVIAVLIMPGAARTRVESVVAALGYAVEHAVPDVHPAAGIVHDLLPLDGAARRVAEWRKRWPGTPCLLYIAPHPGIEPHVTELGRRLGVRLLFQSNDTSESTRLAGFLDEWLGAAALTVVHRALDIVLRDCLPVVTSFAHAATVAVGAPGGARTVAAVAPLARARPWMIQRAGRQRSLPPKELLDWVSLLVIGVTADWTDGDASAAARLLGYRPGRVARLLRNRGLPDDMTVSGPLFFDRALLGLARRCGVAREDVEVEFGRDLQEA